MARKTKTKTAAPTPEPEPDEPNFARRVSKAAGPLLSKSRRAAQLSLQGADSDRTLHVNRTLTLHFNGDESGAQIAAEVAKALKTLGA